MYTTCKINTILDDYSFGFNGQEKEDEVYGEGNTYSAEYWMYDSRLGRRWNIDPVDQISISNDAVLSNNPIIMIDPSGDTDYYNKKGKWIGTDGIDNNAINVATFKKTVKEIKTASKEGMNVSLNLNISKYRDVLVIPSQKIINEIDHSYNQSKVNHRENGGHTIVGSSQAIHWDEGPAPIEIADINKGKYLMAYGAEIEPFGGVEMPNPSDVEFMWHIHFKGQVVVKYSEGDVRETLPYGHASPSLIGDGDGGDIGYVSDMEEKGFKGNSIVVGELTNKVAYYDKNGVTGKISYDVFKNVGNNKKVGFMKNIRKIKSRSSLNKLFILLFVPFIFSCSDKYCLKKDLYINDGLKDRIVKRTSKNYMNNSYIYSFKEDTKEWDLIEFSDMGDSTRVNIFKVNSGILRFTPIIKETGKIYLYNMSELETALECRYCSMSFKEYSKKKKTAIIYKDYRLNSILWTHFTFPKHLNPKDSCCNETKELFKVLNRP